MNALNRRGDFDLLLIINVNSRFRLGSLNYGNRQMIISLLKKLQEDGKTILFVSHDPEVIEVAQRHYDLTDIMDAPRKIMQYKENNDEENLLDVLTLNDDNLKLKTTHALSIMGQERSLDKLLSLIDDRIDITIGISLLLAIRKIAARIDRTISNQHFNLLKMHSSAKPSWKTAFMKSDR
jgi:hypothetical protein